MTPLPPGLLAACEHVSRHVDPDEVASVWDRIATSTYTDPDRSPMHALIGTAIGALEFGTPARALAALTMTDHRAIEAMRAALVPLEARRHGYDETADRVRGVVA